MGSTPSVWRDTLAGLPIDAQFKTKKRITNGIIEVTRPFRAYEQSSILPKARKSWPKQLVFIVGHWRSGTTFLHNLMCQAIDATYVTTYQTVFPNFMGSQWLFRPVMKWVMPDRRPADNVKLNVAYPQEEEFALSAMNPHTYYRFMYFPKHYDRFYRESVTFELLSEEQKAQFTRDYRDLIHLAHWNRPRDTMIIKNPVNTARLPYLMEEFPEAKFIHIYRNPYTVFRSSYKFFTKLLPTLWFEAVSDDFIKEMILDVYVRVHEDYYNALETLHDLDLYELKFEDFEQDPLGHLKQIYSSLDLGDFETSEDQFSSYLRSKKAYKKNVYEFPEELVRDVDAHWGEYVERWGYGVP